MAEEAVLASEEFSAKGKKMVKSLGKEIKSLISNIET